MRESSLVPTNLLNSPQVAPLLPELKLLILALWSSPYMSCAGCGLVPLRPFASTLGLSPEPTASGLELLEKAGLIASDEQTGEIFICAWFRFHKFASPKGYGILLNEVGKIESDTLRELVLSRIPQAPTFKAPSAAPAAPIKKTAPATPANQHRHTDRVDERTGIIVRDDEDEKSLSTMVDKRGVNLLKKIADEIRSDGGRPFVSLIFSELNKNKHKYIGGGEYDPTKKRGPAVSVVD